MRAVWVLSLFVGSAASADGSTWGLAWKAPAECIDASNLAQAVEARLGKHVFGTTPNYKVDGNVTSSGATWKAVFTVSDATGAVVGSRDVTGTGDCRTLDPNLVLVLTVLIDPNIQPTPALPSAPASSTSSQAPEHSVRLRLKTDRPQVQLKRVLAKGITSGLNETSDVTLFHDAPECSGSCDQLVLNSHQHFVIGGDGVTPTSQFVLEEHAIRGDVSLTVKPGNLKAAATGIALGAVGVLSGAAGGALLAFSNQTGLQALAIGLATGGLLSTVIGLVLGLSNRTELIWN